MSTFTSGYAELSTCPAQFLRDDRNVAVHFFRRADDFPVHFWRVPGHAAVDLAVEILHDLRPPLLPPHFRRRDFLSVLQPQRVGKLRIRICFRLVVIRGVGRFRVPIRAAPQRGDVQQVHRALMVLLGCKLNRLRANSWRLCLVGGAEGVAENQRKPPYAKQNRLPFQPELPDPCRPCSADPGYGRCCAGRGRAGCGGAAVGALARNAGSIRAMSTRKLTVSAVGNVAGTFCVTLPVAAHSVPR